MKSLKIMAAFVLVIVFLLGGLSLAMAAVTAPLKFPDAQAELTPRSGTVELETSGTLVWVQVTEPTPVFEGDTIRTGADGEASINLYDQGVLHLAPESVMVIDAAAWDETSPDVFTGEIFLEAGNLWSRLFDFVSPESDFSVRTSTAVATVRGTTFWVGALSDNASRVYVDNHTVDVKAFATGKELAVTSGQMARTETKGQRSSLNYTTPPTGQDLRLIEKYRKWDKAYEDELFARQIDFVHSVRKIDPESSLYTFRRLSERFRLALARNPDERDDLRARFMAGRVLDACAEYRDHNDDLRTKILLQHAADFGGERIAAKADVQRALQCFGHHRGITPATFEKLLDAENEVEEVKGVEEVEGVVTEVIDTQVNLLIDDLPVKTEPVAAPSAEPVLAPGGVRY